MDLTTKSIGLILSGGGTKGLAHAGAIKFLEEKGIKPAHIAGTSAGSIVGALYAGGKSPEEILEFFKSIYFLTGSILLLKKRVLLIRMRLNFISMLFLAIRALVI